jgi:hypothetical protein
MSQHPHNLPTTSTHPRSFFPPLPHLRYTPRMDMQPQAQIPKPLDLGEATGNWATELAFEMALGYFSPEDLQIRFGLDDATFQKIQTDAAFKRSVLSYKKEIDDEGIAFKLRARKAAELVLEELTVIAFDAATDTSDRLKAMEMLARYAGFDMKNQKGEDGGVRVIIQTNLGLSSPLEGRGEYTIAVPGGQQQTPAIGEEP